MESLSTFIGEMVQEAARTNRILNRFEPITLPNASSFSPFFDATMEVTSSGREVPNATIVSPTRVSVIPKEMAIALALSTTRLPPITIAASPPMINTMLKNGLNTLISSSSPEPPAARLARVFFTVLNIKYANMTRSTRPFQRLKLQSKANKSSITTAATMVKRKSP